MGKLAILFCAMSAVASLVCVGAAKADTPAEALPPGPLCYVDGNRYDRMGRGVDDRTAPDGPDHVLVEGCDSYAPIFRERPGRLREGGTVVVCDGHWRNGEDDGHRKVVVCDMGERTYGD